MPRSLPSIPALAAAVTPPATSQLLGPLELAHRLAQTGAFPAAQEGQHTPLLVVVDVRARRRFARGHLPHSHPIPRRSRPRAGRPAPCRIPAPALPHLQELLGNPDLQELLGEDGLVPELGGLRRA